MRKIDLLQAMERLVNMGVQWYKSDFFKYDKPEILKNGPNTYYWYLRDSGTQLIDAKDLEDKKSHAFIDAKYWLNDTVLIAKLECKEFRKGKVYGTIQLIRREEMKKLIEKIETKNIA